MAITINQILSVSYPAVIAAKKKPANQWAESAFMRELERTGGIKRVSFGPTIEEPLDYQRNPSATFLTTDLQATSLQKTEVLTTASYTPASLGVDMLWSKGDEAMNPSENQKVALVKAIIENALESHDDKIETALFSTSTEGFLGLQTLVPDSGQGTVGGINAAVEVWWRNFSGTYLAAGTNIVASLATAFNTAAKGSGGSQPSLIVSGAAAQAIYEGTQAGLRQYIDTKEADAGFKTLAYKDARWIFSPAGGTRIYGLNPKHLSLKVSKEMFRDRGETMELQNGHGYVSKLYSMLQATTNNKSRVFVLTQN